jgi:DNA (cytosine-5)-methyltransferase 1
MNKSTELARQPTYCQTQCYQKPFRVLNLYAGIGGNRKLWSGNIEVTAVELDEKIAAIYKGLYPDDTVIVDDAHQYLLDHYKEFDFIWTSPPCQTHSRANYFINYITDSRYPKMELWQEIIFLKTFFKGKFCVENVISYYEYFIKPTAEIGRHYLWANFKLPKMELPKDEVGTMMKQYSGTKKHAHSKKLEDRNCVNSELGLAIFECALNIFDHSKIEQIGLFESLPSGF